MASLAPYNITLGGTDYPAKYAGMLAYIEPFLTNLETFSFSGGNVGLGVTPGTWTAAAKALDFTYPAFGQDSAGSAFISFNARESSAGNWVYKTTDEAGVFTATTEGAFTWRRAASGTAGNAISFTQAMTLDASGNLLVGKTAVGTAVGIQLIPDGSSRNVMTASTNATSTLEAYSTGAAAFRFYVGMAGTVYATNTTITAISDQRLKENVRDLDAGLPEIMALKPRRFDWKPGKGKDKKGDRGWIAQEFEQVFPDMVDTWQDPAPEGEEPYKAVNADLIPVLVKAIQEQQALITDLRARVAALEAA
jgi:hypothetical protein